MKRTEEGTGDMAKKARVNHRSEKVKGTLTDEGTRISAGVWGQLRPLDEVARKKIERWGDTLPNLVSPDLAGRFEAAYEALRQRVEEQDVVGTNQIATQLIRAWDVLEKEAEKAGHKPLPPHAYCVEIEEKIVCFALHGAAELRKKYPTWIVYSFEDAARVIRFDWTETFLNNAFNTFPNAKVTRMVRDGDERINWDLGGDEIPW